MRSYLPIATGLTLLLGLAAVSCRPPAIRSQTATPIQHVVIIYGEKILNYYIEGTVATSVSLPSSTITITPSTSTAEPIPASGSRRRISCKP